MFPSQTDLRERRMPSCKKGRDAGSDDLGLLLERKLEVDDGQGLGYEVMEALLRRDHVEVVVDDCGDSSQLPAGNRGRDMLSIPSRDRWKSSVASISLSAWATFDSFPRLSISCQRRGKGCVSETTGPIATTTQKCKGATWTHLLLRQVLLDGSLADECLGRLLESPDRDVVDPRNPCKGAWRESQPVPPPRASKRGRTYGTSPSCQGTWSEAAGTPPRAPARRVIVLQPRCSVSRLSAKRTEDKKKNAYPSRCRTGRARTRTHHRTSGGRTSCAGPSRASGRCTVRRASGSRRSVRRARRRA